jgi:hypothetical protein
VATKVQPAPLARPLYEIAAEIKRTTAAGKPLYFAAVPYVEAMGSMETMSDRFYEDSAVSVVTYALSNLDHLAGRGRHAGEGRAEGRPRRRQEEGAAF